MRTCSTASPCSTSRASARRRARRAGSPTTARPSSRSARSPKHGGVQIMPPFYAYAAHRGMQRVLLDLKAAAGREAFLRLAERADVVIESFRPGVVDRLGIGYDAVREREPARSSTARPPASARTGPRSQWAGHDLNYLAVGGYLDCSGRGADGEPAAPGRDHRRQRRRRHARGHGDPRRARAAATATGEGAYLDVSVADGVLALMSLHVDEYLATGEVPGAAPRPPHRPLRLLRRLRQPRTASGSRSPRSSRSFWANLCDALGLRAVDRRTRPTTTRRTRSAPTSRAAFAAADRDEWVAELGRRRHLRRAGR